MSLAIEDFACPDCTASNHCNTCSKNTYCSCGKKAQVLADNKYSCGKCALRDYLKGERTYGTISRNIK